MKRKMVQCATQVNRKSITRMNIGGVEHIVIKSATLPDNVVMNGGLYPADEIAASYMTLERTLAPIEHPMDDGGNFLSASDPVAIHNFHAGAFNVNVRRENGRVLVDKHINVQEAMKTDRGKRLLDRVNEIETNENAKPIHTSVGLFLLVEEVENGPLTNADGVEYTWVARDMVFDHDAILLDSTGAATPEQGVGMALNADGESVEVDRVTLAPTEAQRPNGDGRAEPNDLRTNVEGVSFQQLMDDLQQAIQGSVAGEWLYLVDVFDDKAIFETPMGFFEVPWSMSEGVVQLAGIPIRVDREVTYKPRMNNKKGEDIMKEMILNALKEAGIETDGLTDDQLFAKYNEHMAEKGASANNGDERGIDASTITEAVNKALEPFGTRLDSMDAKLSAADTAELDKLATIVGNSDRYPGLGVDDAKKLGVEALKPMAANCSDAHGLDLGDLTNNQDEAFDAPTEMPD